MTLKPKALARRATADPMRPENEEWKYYMSRIKKPGARQSNPRPLLATPNEKLAKLFDADAGNFCV